VTLSATLVAVDECGNWSYKELKGKNIIDNLAPYVEIWLEEPDMLDCTYGATFLTFGWLALDNCLEDVWIVTNYPRIPCGSELYERPKGTYVYDPETIPGATYDATNTGERQGEFTFCLPYVDCDEFEITIYAVDGQECTDVSTATLSVFIDNKPPEIITFDTDLTDDCNTATSTVIEWSVTDGSYDDKNGCHIGSIEVSHGTLSGDSTSTLISTTDGTVTWNLEGLNHVTVTATLTVWDICCDPCDENGNSSFFRLLYDPYTDTLEVSEPLTYLVDNVSPEAILDFEDRDGFPGEECGATSTVLWWGARDIDFWYPSTYEGTGCLAEVWIELSHGEIEDALDVDGTSFLVWQATSEATSTADGTVTWLFGDVNGETICATVTAYDCCGNESRQWSGSSLCIEDVDNVAPGVERFRFNAKTNKLWLWFDEDVLDPDDISATVTVIVYVWTGEGDPDEFDFPGGNPVVVGDWARINFGKDGNFSDDKFVYYHEDAQGDPLLDTIIVDLDALNYNLEIFKWYAFVLDSVTDECENEAVATGFGKADHFAPGF
jgi:hypothetical protein